MPLQSFQKIPDLSRKISVKNEKKIAELSLMDIAQTEKICGKKTRISLNSRNYYISEVLKKFRATFGDDIYESWIKNINLKKEFNHYVILSAPTRFVRDWIVSRYADKILDIIKTFKISIQRIEFSIDEQEEKITKTNVQKNFQASPIENSLLNYNRFNFNNSL